MSGASFLFLPCFPSEMSPSLTMPPLKEEGREGGKREREREREGKKEGEEKERGKEEEEEDRRPRAKRAFLF